MTETNQQIISAITNIKIAGIVTMSYWSILETGDSIYFVQTGSALGLGVGTTGLLAAASIASDIAASNASKQTAGQDIGSVLEGSVRHFVFSKDTLAQVQVKKGLLGGTIIFPNGQQKSWKETGTVKLKLSGKKYRSFSQILQRKLAAQ